LPKHCDGASWKGETLSFFGVGEGRRFDPNSLRLDGDKKDAIRPGTKKRKGELREKKKSNSYFGPARKKEKKRGLFFFIAAITPKVHSSLSVGEERDERTSFVLLAQIAKTITIGGKGAIFQSREGKKGSLISSERG